MQLKQPQSSSYLLRLWATDTRDGPVWRLSLENIHTGKRIGFPSVDAFSFFLKEEIGEPIAKNLTSQTGE